MRQWIGWIFELFLLVDLSLIFENNMSLVREIPKSHTEKSVCVCVCARASLLGIRGADFLKSQSSLWAKMENTRNPNEGGMSTQATRVLRNGRSHS